MYSGNGVLPPQSSFVERAGTLDSDTLDVNATPKPRNSHMDHLARRQILKTSGTGHDEEQTLEQHEVIELQAFSERKAWIEEKIKFLEKMPPVEVFVGLDAVRSSAEAVPGLPSKEELEQWLVEHDKIEKETEIFDSGELSKLKKLTRAATQRNLSPEDTDLIELTLNTILQLDILLHLLRDRSDNLELLGIRLTWEERRISAWRELRSILADLRQFLDTRGRWNPTIYDSSLSEDEDPAPPFPQSPQILPTRTLKRKDSIVSLASSTSESVLPSLVLSRSERFKLAERLSRDAARFSSRVSSLKHNKINAAGKALDKLIDTSRKPVPDEFLDEQDRLEDQGLNGMEDIGKFVMNVVMQWKKADEIYIETIKDKNSAQTLLEEIETAKLFQPTSRQDTSFLARSATLFKRLEMRGDPSATNSGFPRPYHPLFEDQEDTNATILEILSSELAVTVEHARRAEAAAKEYHATFEAVKRVEVMCQAAADITERFGSILQRLEIGTESPAGDGSPPDLETEECLEYTKHAVFLSLFPSLLDELARVDLDAGVLLQDSRSVLLAVGRPGIDHKFASDSVAAIDLLDTQRASCARARDLAVVRVSTLKRVRETWDIMAKTLEQLDDVRTDIVDAIKRDMWRSQTQQDAATLTPESPASVLPPKDVDCQACSAQLDTINSQLQQQVVSPLDVMSPSLGPRLKGYLTDCSSALAAALEDAKRISRFSISVKTQAQEMMIIRDEAHSLQMRLEDLKMYLDSAYQQKLQGDEHDQRFAVPQSGNDDFQTLQDTANAFIDSLPRRIPLVTRTGPTSSVPPPNVPSRRHFSVSGFSLSTIQQATFTAYPVDPVALDRAVRTDANSFSMLLAGAVESVKQKEELLRIAGSVREIDRVMSPLVEALRQASDALASVQAPLDEASDHIVSLEQLSTLAGDVDQLYPQYGPGMASSLSQLRGLFEQLQARLNKHDATIANAMSSPRRRRLEDLDQQFSNWKENVEVLSERISDVQHLEQVRIAEETRRELERQRIEAEAKAKEEQERLERERLEREYLEREAQATEEERRRPARNEQESPEAKIQRVASYQFLFPLSEDTEDVFNPAPSTLTIPQELSDLGSLVRSLRKRLRQLDIDEIVRPDKRGTALLPTSQHCAKLETEFSDISQEAENLPQSVEKYPALDTELRSLHSEVALALKGLSRVKRLARLTIAIQACDNALSDLLEHIDSFPAPPAGPLASTYITDTSTPPEEQMSARLAFTRGLIDEFVLQCADLADDGRTVSERERLLQTWQELQAMALDRVNGQKSRPPSVMSSGRSSRASAISNATVSSVASTKAPTFPRRDSSRPRGHLLAPPASHARRSTSTGTANGPSRSSSRTSVSNKRSVSGPANGTPTLSRLQTPTFASRQRSSSVASTSSPVPSTVKKHSARPSLTAAPPTITRPRALTSQSHRAASPTFSEASTSGRTRSSLNASQSSISRSSWARAPRQSFPIVPKVSPPRKRQNVSPTRPYIPNPKNKLDVAVGDVVNSLPVNINIEVVEETWRDQSGKYWIGDEDPKLCFCRILRSQTVMVRVGGGWTELSKFIKEHFTEAFRLLPDSPPRAKPSEEKWISSATLTQAMQARESSIPLSPPRTPEPRSSVPSFSVSTPSPRSVESSGSPLRAIQFIRRAERDSPVYRPETPTKMSRSAASSLNTPRQPAWRP